MKHRTGHLFKRGSNFYLRWTVEGKVFSKALRDDRGQPITTKREAEDAQQKLMAPFAVASEAEVLESIVGKLEGRKAELAKLDEKENPPLPLSQAWSEFIASPSRPDTGPQTLVIYEYQFGRFTGWMTEEYPDSVRFSLGNLEVVVSIRPGRHICPGYPTTCLGSYPLIGGIDEVRFYNRAFSPW